MASVLVIGAAIALSKSFGFLTTKDSLTPEVQDISETPLGLKVAWEAGQLSVRWNHEAPALAQATRGVMTITDGGAAKLIELTNKQLRDGSIAYFPMSDDVNIRLDVSQATGRSIGESVRVLTSPVSASQHGLDTHKTGLLAWLNAAAEETGRSVSSHRQAGSSAAPAREGGNGAIRTEPGQTTSLPVQNPAERTRPFVPPPVRQPVSTSPPNVPEAPPVIQPASAVRMNALLLSSDVGPAAPGPFASATNYRDATAPRELSRGSAAVGRTPLPSETQSATATAPEITPAQVVRWTTPSLPSSFFRSGITAISVMIHLDQEGKLINARLPEKSKGVPPEIARAILNAVRNWEFRPATVRGNRVASDLEIELKFAR